LWKVCDYRSIERDNGCDVQVDEFFLIQNTSTGEVKWVNEYEYIRFKSLRIIE
jgi:hypothetical protein